MNQKKYGHKKIVFKLISWLDQSISLCMFALIYEEMLCFTFCIVDIPTAKSVTS